MNNRYNENCMDPAAQGNARGMQGFAGWLLFALFGLVAFPASMFGAQSAPAKAPAPADRCLIIVETSKSMQRREEAMLTVVQDLLTSGLNGQLPEGGTVGLWTFNGDLSAGKFPLQMWSADRRKYVAERAWSFLKGQEYQRRADFTKVVPALDRLVSDSDLLTVVLITSGDWPVVGTPFDRQINQSYQQWHDKQVKARAPFVTVLRVSKGHFAAYSVNTPPWPIQVPHLADAPKSSPGIQEKLMQALYSPSTSAVPSLVVSAKEPVPESGPTPKPQAIASAMSAPAPLAAVPVTHEVASDKPADPPAPPAEAAKAEPTPAVHEKSASAPPTAPPPASVAPPEPKVETVKAPEPQAAGPAPAVSEPAPAAAQLPSPTVASQATIADALTSNVVATVTPLAPRPQIPAQSAVTLSPPSLLSAANVSAVAVLLAIGLIAMALLLVRRRRRVPLGSLITHVIDQEKGP